MLYSPESNGISVQNVLTVARAVPSDSFPRRDPNSRVYPKGIRQCSHGVAGLRCAYSAGGLYEAFTHTAEC
jgi:hypothetical protein